MDIINVGMNSINFHCYYQKYKKHYKVTESPLNHSDLHSETSSGGKNIVEERRN